MLRRLTYLGVVAALIMGGVAALFGVQAAFGHECVKNGSTETCQDSAVVPNWRDSYVPLFEVNGRNDSTAARKDAQRWREECGNQQMCAWAYGGTSVTPGQGGELAPNELHVGFAASHCFLAETQHQCEGHDPALGESVHDKHGGAIYADVCLEPNPDSPRCKQGPADTQAGVTIVDHNDCGTVVPIVACIDEYHVVRPADPAYTAQQMANSQAEIAAIANDPHRYLCGYGPGSESCVVPPALP